MAKSIKLKNNNYIDSTGIVHNRELLSTVIENLKNIDSHKRIEIWSGSAGSGTEITINKTWSEIGKFNKLIAQVNWGAINSLTNCEFVFELLSTGNNVYDGRRNSNVYSSMGRLGDSNACLHLIPYTSVKTNKITFDGHSFAVTRLWVQY